MPPIYGLGQEYGRQVRPRNDFPFLALPLGLAPWPCPLGLPLCLTPCLTPACPPVCLSVCVSAALRRALGYGFGLRRALLRLWAAALAVALGCGFGLWRALMLPTPFPSAPTWCLGHHHLPVLLFLLPRVRRYAVVPILDAISDRLLFRRRRQIAILGPIIEKFITFVPSFQYCIGLF